MTARSRCTPGFAAAAATLPHRLESPRAEIADRRDGAGVLLGDEEPPLPNISVATTKLLRGIERAIGADEELVAERAAAAPRRQQNRVVLRRVQLAPRSRTPRARCRSTPRFRT